MQALAGAMTGLQSPELRDCSANNNNKNQWENVPGRRANSLSSSPRIYGVETVQVRQTKEQSELRTIN